MLTTFEPIIRWRTTYLIHTHSQDAAMLTALAIRATLTTADVDASQPVITTMTGELFMASMDLRLPVGAVPGLLMMAACRGHDDVSGVDTIEGVRVGRVDVLRAIHQEASR